MSVSAYVLHCASPKADELLYETLSTLDDQDYEALEVTVVGNGVGPTDTGRWLHLPTNVGVARGYNAALNDFLGAGQSEYCLLLNNDIAAAPSLVSELIRTAEAGFTTGVVCPRIFYYGSKRIWYDGGLFNPWTGVSRHKNIRKIGPADLKPKSTEWATGCCMLIKREVVEEVGFFDESFSPAYSEDIDYSMRVRGHGWRIMVNPKAKLYHKVSQSINILEG